MNDQEQLDQWRKEIRAIDQEIIAKIARRMELALQIGHYKADHQLPVKDFRVEKEIIERTRTLAQGLGLAPDFAEDLMGLVMSHSVREQNKLHQSLRSETDSSQKEVLIVGGMGRMGRWFSQYFHSIGFRVSVADIRKEELEEPFRRHDDLTSDLDRYELIFLTTPISATQNLLQVLASNPPRGLVIESSSLKTPLREALKKLSEKGVRIASIHPMFGPETDLLIDKNILICEGDSLESFEAASAYFHATSAQLVKVDIESHDKDMLSTLSLVHLINLIFGLSLAEQSLAVERAIDRGGSSFHDQLRTSRTLFSENPDLYFDIQAQNPFQKELFQGVHKVLDRLEDLVRKGDRSGFLAEIDRTKVFLKNSP